MKLGIRVKPDGVLIVVVAETGEEIEGQRFVEATSGIRSNKKEPTIVKLEFYAYDEQGNMSIG